MHFSPCKVTGLGSLPAATSKEVLTELRHKRTRTSAYLVKFNISQQNMGCGRIFAAIDADFRCD